MTASAEVPFLKILTLKSSSIIVKSRKCVKGKGMIFGKYDICHLRIVTDGTVAD